MLMYNLTEYSDNYADSSGSLYQFKRDESPMTDAGNPLNVTLNNSASFKFNENIQKTKSKKSKNSCSTEIFI